LLGKKTWTQQCVREYNAGYAFLHDEIDFQLKTLKGSERDYQPFITGIAYCAFSAAYFCGGMEAIEALYKGIVMGLTKEYEEEELDGEIGA